MQEKALGTQPPIGLSNPALVVQEAAAAMVKVAHV